MNHAINYMRRHVPVDSKADLLEQLKQLSESIGYVKLYFYSLFPKKHWILNCSRISAFQSLKTSKSRCCVKPLYLTFSDASLRIIIMWFTSKVPKYTLNSSLTRKRLVTGLLVKCLQVQQCTMGFFGRPPVNSPEAKELLDRGDFENLRGAIYSILNSVPFTNNR